MISRGVAGDSPSLAPGVYWTRSIAGLPVSRASPARATEATLIKLELNKSIEARKLNKRTGSPTTDPEVVIPYGAIVENVEAHRDFERFTYLGELYHCSHTLLASATDPRAWKAQRAPAAESAAPAESSAGQPAPKLPRLLWTPVDSSPVQLLRAKVKGGWLIAAGSGAGLTFYPDPDHEWE
jgi:hypothetical protein